MSADIHLTSFPVTLLNNATRTVFKVPAYGGGITILAGQCGQAVAGTHGLHLVTLGTAGTAVDGTAVSWGSMVYGAGTARAGTVVTAYVGENYWIGIKEDNSGTTGTVCTVAFEYVAGK